MCTHRLRHIRETNVEKFCHDRKITSKLPCNNVIKFMDDKMKPVTIFNLVIHPKELPKMKYIDTEYFGRGLITFYTFYLFLNIKTNVLSFFCFRLGPLTVFLDVLFLKF